MFQIANSPRNLSVFLIIESNLRDVEGNSERRNNEARGRTKNEGRCWIVLGEIVDEGVRSRGRECDSEDCPFLLPQFLSYMATPGAIALGADNLAGLGMWLVRGEDFWSVCKGVMRQDQLA